jgi:hypothetical protein
MSILQLKGLIKKNIVEYVKCYQIAYDLVSIIFSAAYVLAMTYITDKLYYRTLYY